MLLLGRCADLMENKTQNNYILQKIDLIYSPSVYQVQHAMHVTRPVVFLCDAPFCSKRCHPFCMCQITPLFVLGTTVSSLLIDLPVQVTDNNSHSGRYQAREDPPTKPEAVEKDSNGPGEAGRTLEWN